MLASDPSATLSARVVTAKYRAFPPSWSKPQRLSGANARTGAIGKPSRVRRFARWLKEFASFPDAAVGWYPGAVAEGARLLATCEHACILSTSPPETTHLVAKTLSKRSLLPWLADLRDPWTEYHHANPPKMRRWLDKWLERRTLCDADRVITVSHTWAEILGESYPRAVCIRNGFESDDLESPSPRLSNGEPIVIRHLGKVHPLFQNPGPFFDGLAKAVATRPQITDRLRIEFYAIGTTRQHIERRVNELNLAKVVTCHSPVSHEEAIALTSDATAALVFGWQDGGRIGRGVIPAKLYEAIGFADSTILIGPQESEAAEVARSFGRSVLITLQPEEVQQALLALVDDGVDAAIPRLEPQSNLLDISRREEARQLATLLDEVIQHPHGRSRSR